MATKPLTQSQAAAILGVSLRRVQQMVQHGDAPATTTGGGFKPDAFGVWLKERHKEEFGVAQDGHARDLSAERARLAQAQAEKTLLDVSEQRGELVRLTDVIAEWSRHIASARAKLLSLPSKIAPRVAGPAKVAEVQELLRDIIDETLNELAGDGVPERARGRRARVQRVEGAAKADGKRVVRSRKKTKPRS